MRATQIRGAMGNEGQPPATLHSKGCADVAIGVERLAKELPDLAFVPLQTEWLDIAVEKNRRSSPLVREIRKIAESESFRSAIDAIEGYEATNTGHRLRELDERRAQAAGRERETCKSRGTAPISYGNPR